MGRLFLVERDASVRTQIICSTCQTFIASCRNMDIRHLYHPAGHRTGIYFTSVVNVVEIASQRIEDDGVAFSICLYCVKCGNFLGYKRYPHDDQRYPPIPCLFCRKVLLTN